MNKKHWIKDNALQIIALTEIHGKLRLRTKFGVLVTYINPLIAILFPIIIVGKIFTFTPGFGPWTAENYFLFMFTGYNIILMKTIIDNFPKYMINEKYWKTLKALIIAPFNRINLLLGIF